MDPASAVLGLAVVGLTVIGLDVHYGVSFFKNGCQVSSFEVSFIPIALYPEMESG